MFDLLINGFMDVFTFYNLMLILIGTILGIIFGALPGITATLGIVVCLPITYGMSAISGFSMLIGLYIGGMSGGLISATLINIPGTGGSVATCFDAYPMSMKGEGGKALGVGIVCSFIGTIFSIILLSLIAPNLAKIAIRFGPMEYFALSFFSLTMVAGLSGKSIMKGMVSACIGMMLAMVGEAPIDGYPRFTLGFHAFDAGFSLLPALVGLFAVSEVLKTVKTTDSKTEINLGDTRIKGFGFTLKEFVSQIRNMFVSAVIGVGIGILPGIGGGASNIIAYGVAKNTSRHPEKFGTGIIDGVVASETSNNASIGGAMVPLLTLGIPGDTITAVLLGAFMVHGLQPGPLLFRNNSDFVYAIFAAMIIASFMMLFVELVFIRGFIKVLNIPKYLLIPAILVLCIVGAFAVNNRLFDLWVFLGFGIIGALLSKFDYPLAPVILGFLLGPYVELYLMRGMQLTRGNFLPFLKSPISGIFILIAVLTFIVSIYRNLKQKYKSR